ncbi:MAG: hypothetical protein QXD03_02220 [Candidatus Anstonellales archaeon]
MGLFGWLGSGKKFIDKAHDNLNKVTRLLSLHDDVEKSIKNKLKDYSTEKKFDEKGVQEYLNIKKEHYDKLPDSEKKRLKKMAAQVKAIEDTLDEFKLDKNTVQHIKNNISNSVSATVSDEEYNHSHSEKSISSIIDNLEQIAGVGNKDKEAKAKIREKALGAVRPGWQRRVTAGTVGGLAGGAGLTVAAKAAYDYLKSKGEKEGSEESSPSA